MYIRWLFLLSCVICLAFILSLIVTVKDLKRREMKTIIKLQDRLIEDLCRISTKTEQRQDVSEDWEAFWKDKINVDKRKLWKKL